jgi:membrane associated rhomboid family serine protease
MAGFDGAPFVKWTVILTVGIHLVGLGSAEARDWLYSNLQHDNIDLANGELWRMLSHALLHSQGSLLHILFNMYALYLFGPTLERRVGSAAFAGMYAASAVAGSAAAFFLGPITMRAVGASGAVFGLFGAWLYVSWKMRSSVQGRAQFNQLAVLLAINLALPLFIPNVAWQAHVGGLAAGLLLAWVWSVWAVGSGNPEARRVTAAIGVLLLSVGLVAVTGPGRVSAASDCTGLVEQVQADATLTANEVRAIRSDAFDGFFAAEASNRPLDARLCSLVANIDDPQTREFIRSVTVEELVELIRQG